MDMPQSGHQPVLVQEILDLLDPKPGMTMLDCTLGRSGHAAVLLPLLSPGGRFIGLDVDPANVEFGQAQLANAPVPVDIVQANFVQARQVLDDLGVDRVDLLLADLGFSSSQMDDPTRGFSFRVDAPLDMRMNPTLPRSAGDLVNSLSAEDLANLLYHFGQERFSRAIAAKIVAQRAEAPINRTDQLAQIVRQVYASKGNYGRRQKGSKAKGSRGRPIDPATRTFMALRIAVNAELDALERLLKSIASLMRNEGRAAIISFHSLEDRMVKRSMAQWHQEGLGKKLTPKPIIAGESERNANPRSRSAKLRVVQIIQQP
jgi:16S rRNA (cytosine1402-N4)-methyltransferase